jgi:N utilization substance protein A
MDIDLSVLRSLESEKDISLETVIKAIEDALLMAYHKTEGASLAARVEVDRKTGHVTVWARETSGVEGATPREYDDTPAGFGRIAATTARQVILQRLRDVEDEMTFGEYAGHEGDIVAGVIQQGPADGASGPRQDRGRAAAGRAGPWRALRTRRAHPLLRVAGA